MHSSIFTCTEIKLSTSILFQPLILQHLCQTRLLIFQLVSQRRPRNLEENDQFPDPDLIGDIHPLLARDMWSQDDFVQFHSRDGQRTQAPGGTQEHPVLAYNIDNKAGVFDASTNDQIWGVLQPSLRLVTKIIRIHPVWEALLNIYHLRPVPSSSDSRTPDQLAEDGHIPRTSFWYVHLPSYTVLGLIKSQQQRVKSSGHKLYTCIHDASYKSRNSNSSSLYNHARLIAPSTSSLPAQIYRRSQGETQRNACSRGYRHVYFHLPSSSDLITLLLSALEHARILQYPSTGLSTVQL